VGLIWRQLIWRRFGLNAVSMEAANLEAVNLGPVDQQAYAMNDETLFIGYLVIVGL